MYFTNIKDFIEMGGHGFYVWMSYFIVFSLMLFYYVFSNRLAKKRTQELSKFYRRIESRSVNDGDTNSVGDEK